MTAEAVTGWEFAYGGLFDATPEDGVVHVIRQLPTHGTPGATFCGRSRFGIIAPGGGWNPTERSRQRRRSHVGGHPVRTCPDCLFALETGHELHTATATPTALGEWDARGASRLALQILTNTAPLRLTAAIR